MAKKKRSYTKSAAWYAAHGKFARFDSKVDPKVDRARRRKAPRIAVKGSPRVLEGTPVDWRAPPLGSVPVPISGANSRDENLHLVLTMLSTQLHETEHWRRMVSALEANARDFSAKLAQLNDDYDKACQDRDSLQREVNGFRSIGDSPRENNVEHFTATPIRD